MTVASEFELFCEHCGYSIKGLDPTGRCPECGKSIAESRPQRRPGTPAQRDPSLRALLLTVWMALTARARMWEEVRIGGAADRRIYIVMIVFASTLASLHAALMVFMSWWQDPEPFRTPTETLLEFLWWVAISAGATPFLIVAICLLLAAFSGIERRGIRIFGRLHGRRITPAVANTIISHASAGWLVGAALLTPAWLLGRALAAAADHIDILRWELVFVLPTLLPTAAALLGLLLFEIITYTGVLRLRYANREPPAEAGGMGVSPVRSPPPPRQDACPTTAKDPAP